MSSHFGSLLRDTPIAENGFAVIGFSDTITREVGPDIEAQVRDVFTIGLTSGKLPDYWSQATGEQLSMLRLIEALSSLDVVPLGAPDGEPDLDVAEDGLQDLGVAALYHDCGYAAGGPAADHHYIIFAFHPA